MGFQPQVFDQADDDMADILIVQLEPRYFHFLLCGRQQLDFHRITAEIFEQFHNSAEIQACGIKVYPHLSVKWIASRNAEMA